MSFGIVDEQTSHSFYTVNDVFTWENTFIESLNLRYNDSCRVSIIITTLISLPLGYINSLEEGQKIINDIYDFFGGELENQKPQDRTYLTSLKFFEDVLRLMLLKTGNKDVFDSILDMIYDVQKDINAHRVLFPSS